MTTNLPTSDSQAHRELFDPEFAAEQRRLGRRRVTVITLISTLGGVAILGGFLAYGWIYGESLPVRGTDRFCLVTAGTVSEIANGITIRLDRERITKHRSRDGHVRLTYEYDDGPLQIYCRIDFFEDLEQAKSVYQELASERVKGLQDRGWTCQLPAANRVTSLGDESSYGSLISEEQALGHFLFVRTANKTLVCEITGHSFDSADAFERLREEAVQALEVYKP